MICLTDIELIFIIEPPSFSIIFRAAANDPKKDPLKIVSITSLKSSSVTSNTDPNLVRAALFTKMSIRPNFSQTLAILRAAHTSGKIPVFFSTDFKHSS